MGGEQREDHLKKGSNVSPYEALFAGSVAGGISRAITAPLDTIKIRLQLETHSFSQRQSIATIVRSLLKNEGVVALWKGNVPAEIMYILYGGVQFASYSTLSTNLAQLEQHYRFSLSPAMHSLVVGSGAGLASTLATYPFDLLRTRLVANKNRNLVSMTGTIKHILKTEGVSGMFAGIKPASISVASTTGLMFWSYELARSFSQEYNNIPFIEGICGFIAGVTSKGITFPLDTLRKRCQVYAVVHGSKPIGALRLFIGIIKQEGIFGLYKGYGVSILKTAPTSALSLWIYEYTISFVKSRTFA
ncbi:TPC1 [Candida theae]|uniref:Mitochondrial thiamine pyrophosphate carrier 1 n=1 Tax=Candida theae TaxID=1198502 RepID=A0AAD5BEJ5_9ASCO|nr:TPC1 [Candida theae]KAI5958234.1 TPC1 [Candida theae]